MLSSRGLTFVRHNGWHIDILHNSKYFTDNFGTLFVNDWDEWAYLAPSPDKHGMSRHILMSELIEITTKLEELNNAPIPG